jgi:hypothetical protein
MQGEQAEDIESEPELPIFLSFLLDRAMTDPEGLVDASLVFAKDADLVVGAKPSRAQATARLLERSARLVAGVAVDEG